MYIQDSVFGRIVNFDELRRRMRSVYDAITPNFNLLRTVETLSEHFDDDPNLMIAGGASMLAYMMIPAAGEYELAEELKGNLFTLGWTEEQTGSDLLSIRTTANKVNDDPDDKTYHLSGGKWMINNSYHADYHCVLAKIAPVQDGPRSLSLFLVPRSSTRNWERLETHVLKGMVLTKFEVEGEGRLLGKAGHGLQIVQRMALPSKYQCSWMGMRMLRRSVPEAINWLAQKNIFGVNPIQFSNVFRQLYNLSLQKALLEFTYYRANSLNVGDFLQFHGTMLKSWLLLRVNEMLSQTWLVMGSKGFLAESPIGRDAIDSFILPVFDGHYTVNTLMTSKHAERYLHSEETINADERIEGLRQDLFNNGLHGEMEANSRTLRQPNFFNLPDYFNQLKLPINVPIQEALDSFSNLLAEVQSRGEMGNEPEYKYKTGDLVHWLESVLSAAELWKVTENDHYLNGIIQQFNGFVKHFNDVVSEGGLMTGFMTPLRQLPLPNVSDPKQFLLDLCNVEKHVRCYQLTAQPTLS